MLALPIDTTPALLALFNLGGTEMIVILLIVLVLFGGDKMPELARGIGKAMRDFKKAAAGVEEELKKAMEEAPAKKTHRPNEISHGGATAPGDEARRFNLPQPLSTRPPGEPSPESAAPEPQEAEPHPGAFEAAPKPPTPPVAPPAP